MVLAVLLVGPLVVAAQLPARREVPGEDEGDKHPDDEDAERHVAVRSGWLNFMGHGGDRHDGFVGLG